jgi:hypothetical protein
MGVAMALSARELVVVAVFFAFLGRRAVDGRSMLSITKSLGISCGVIAIHQLLAPIGPARILVDGVAYAALALAIGVVRRADVVAVLQMIRDRKKARAA